MYKMRLMEGQSSKLESAPISRRTTLKWLVAGTYVSGEIAEVTADYVIQARTGPIYNVTKVASYALRVFGFVALASSLIDLHDQSKTQAEEIKDLKKLLTRRAVFMEGLIDGHTHDTTGQTVSPIDLTVPSIKIGSTLIK